MSLANHSAKYIDTSRKAESFKTSLTTVRRHSIPPSILFASSLCCTKQSVTVVTLISNNVTRTAGLVSSLCVRYSWRGTAKETLNKKYNNVKGRLLLSITLQPSSLACCWLRSFSVLLLSKLI